MLQRHSYYVSALHLKLNLLAIFSSLIIYLNSQTLLLTLGMYFIAHLVTTVRTLGGPHLECAKKQTLF